MFSRLSLKWHGTLIKRFLVCHGDALEREHPAIYRAFCEKVGDLLGGCPEPNAGAFLIELARQPVPLSLKQFIDGLLSPVHVRSGLFNFNLWQWREFHEVLVFNDESKGRERWMFLRRWNPSKYAGDYPSSEGARAAFLSGFKSKQELVEEWLEEESSEKLRVLEKECPELPSRLMSIIASYAIEWP